MILIIINRRKAGELLERVTSPKLHTQYARAQEADGMYKEAAKAYEAAKDHENAVRYESNCTYMQFCIRLSVLFTCT